MKVPHIYEHFDFSTFPDKDESRLVMGTRLTKNDLAVTYGENYITLRDIWAIVHSRKGKIVFGDLKKGLL